MLPFFLNGSFFARSIIKKAPWCLKGVLNAAKIEEAEHLRTHAFVLKCMAF